MVSVRTFQVDSSFQAELLESEALQIAQEQIQLLESQLKEREEQLQHQEEQLKQSENFSFLLLSHRLLAPGLPLNGAENTPAMRVLGSPKTLTELHLTGRQPPELIYFFFRTSKCNM